MVSPPSTTVSGRLVELAELLVGRVEGLVLGGGDEVVAQRAPRARWPFVACRAARPRRRRAPRPSRAPRPAPASRSGLMSSRSRALSVKTSASLTWPRSSSSTSAPRRALASRPVEELPTRPPCFSSRCGELGALDLLAGGEAHLAVLHRPLHAGRRRARARPSGSARSCRAWPCRAAAGRCRGGRARSAPSSAGRRRSGAGCGCGCRRRRRRT